MGKGAVWIIGLIYTLLGGLFLVLGLVLGLAVRENGLMIGGIFAGIGGIFFVLGVIFLLAERRKAVRNRRLVEAGRYIVGEIADLQLNYSVSLNNRHPYIAIVRYTDWNGTAHVFKSGSIYRYPDPSLLGSQVKIYVEDDSFRHYYVDMEEVLSAVVEH
ncbi:MAG TPA: hypothetical protein IAB22_06740 [Candidatus Merdivicinus intestinavium]|nr:hypothetical protein [Candidatus Merdivicinus intestinavium]